MGDENLRSNVSPVPGLLASSIELLGVCCGRIESQGLVAGYDGGSRAGEHFSIVVGAVHLTRCCVEWNEAEVAAAAVGPDQSHKVDGTEVPGLENLDQGRCIEGGWGNLSGSRCDCIVLPSNIERDVWAPGAGFVRNGCDMSVGCFGSHRDAVTQEPHSQAAKLMRSAAPTR